MAHIKKKFRLDMDSASVATTPLQPPAPRLFAGQGFGGVRAARPRGASRRGVEPSENGVHERMVADHHFSRKKQSYFSGCIVR